MRAPVVIALAGVMAIVVWVRRHGSTEGPHPSPHATLRQPGAIITAHVDPIISPDREIASDVDTNIVSAEIRGQVVERGTHVPIAGVVVVGRGDPIPGLGLAPITRATAITDDTGHFTLADLSPGHFDLAVESNGWFGRVTIAAPAVDDVVIEAIAGVVVTGRVDGSCAVVLRSETTGLRASGDGAVRFDTVPPGHYQVRVACGMRSSDAGVLEIADRAVDDLDWRLDPGLAISGRVVDPNGQAVSGAAIALETAAGVVDGRADADGRFEVTGLIAGIYAVAVVAEDRRLRSAQVDVDAGTRDVSLITLAAGALHGLAEHAHDAMTAFATGDDGIVASTSVHADGTFAFDDLAPGTQRVVVCDPWAGEVGASTATVEVDRTSEVRVGVQSFDVAIAGHVVDERGRPAGEAAVAVVAEANDESPCAPSLDDRPAIATDDDGRFQLPPLPTRSYRVRAIGVAGGHGSVLATPGAPIVVVLGGESIATRP